MKVSVVIPFYSHKDWLLESLESVFDQTYHDYEVILVNDGSKEDINDVLEKYRGVIKYLEQENKGPAAARNYGMSVAEGEYIAFEDSDDIWLPNKLTEQVSFMEDKKLVWSHTGFYYWWPQANRLKEVCVDKDFGEIYVQRYISVKMATPCVMIRRDFMEKEKLKFPHDYRNGEDDVVWTAIAKKAPVGLLKEPLAKIRMRGTNSNTHAIERFRNNDVLYYKLKDNAHGIPTGVVRIKYIYHLYAKLFTGEITPFKDFMAKCLWVLPFSLERLYLKLFIKKTENDYKYLKTP